MENKKTETKCSVYISGKNVSFSYLVFIKYLRWLLSWMVKCTTPPNRGSKYILDVNY